MPVVSDFITIRDDSPISIGDSNTEWTAKFGTGGRHAAGGALLLLNVSGLTHAVQSVEVKINDSEVGRIYPYSLVNGSPNQEASRHWYTQMIHFPGSQLRNGENTLRIRAIGFPGSTGSNQYDDYQLKDIVCFFHQNA